MGRRVQGWTVAIAGTALLASGVPAAVAAKPNLRTTKVSNPPKTVVLSGSFRVKDTAANKGGKRAGSSTTRFYLSSDKKFGLGDILMGGSRGVPALAPGKRSTTPKKRRIKAVVDIGTPTGEYFLLACADSREAVRESKEGDNCRAAKRKLRVTSSVVFADALRFDAIDDTAPEVALELDEPRIVAQRTYRCTPTPKARVPSLDRAIENITTTIETKVGEADYAAFKKSKDYRKPRAAAEAAMAAFLLEQPGAALAAMIRAHELEPKDASHLLNAAGLASSIGMHSEALALLDAAELRDDKQLPPMGISRSAMALGTRAHALASLGDYTRAVQMADAAVAIEPLLSEAAQTAGMAELCAGRPSAVARIRKSRRRQPAKKPPLDDSRGKETELRHLPLPATPEQAVEMAGFYRGQQQDFLTEIQQRNSRESEIKLRINGRPNDPSRNLNRKLLHAVHMASGDPDLKSLREEMSDLWDKSHTWYREKWCDGDSCHDEEWQRIVESCDGDEECVKSRCVPATKSWHQGWLNDQAQLYTKAQEYMRAVSKRMSALAAHIKDPDTYELAMLAIESEEQSVYAGVHQPAYYWSDWVRRAKDDCVTPYEPPPPPDEPGAADANGSGPCPTGLDSLNFVIPLDVLSVKVNCNEIQIGASTTKWLGGFAEVTHNFRTGKSTMFAGVQAGVSAGPLKADFKSGIYVTSSNQGIEDMGMRAGPSVSAGGKALEVSGPSDYVDISFVPVFASN